MSIHDILSRALAFCAGSRDAAAAAAAAQWGSILLHDGARAVLQAIAPLARATSQLPTTFPATPTAPIILDILGCIAPHTPSVGAAVSSLLPPLLPLITSSPAPVHTAWLRLLIAICAAPHRAGCSAAARDGALLLPVRLAQSGSAEDIMSALTALHSMASSVLVPHADYSASAVDGDDCLLCRSGALQAMTFVMRSSDDPDYTSLAASVLLLQCRHVQRPL